jgi:hypothetical protein
MNEMKLPTSAMNMFLNDRQIRVLDDASDTHVVEMHVPGIVEPENVTATLHECKAQQSNDSCCAGTICNCSWKCVVVAGKLFNEQHQGRVSHQVSVYKIADFEEHLKVPFNAVDPIPKITITLARDNCGNVTEGILRVEWKVAVDSIPIEIKECK